MQGIYVELPMLMDVLWESNIFITSHASATVEACPANVIFRNRRTSLLLACNYAEADAK
jgi:hypothetical protein